MAKLSPCVEELAQWWEETGGVINQDGCALSWDEGNRRAIETMFSIRGRLLDMVRELEVSILKVAPWEPLLQRGKGRDLLWELDQLWVEAVRDGGEGSELQSLIGDLRVFLLEGNYSEEDLGTIHALE